jgi:hypothetical protein
MDLQYGKRETCESFFKGELKSTKVTYSVPILVMDRTQALSEVMKALELITSCKTHKVSLTIEADPKSYNFKMVTKSYTLIE